MRFKGSFAQMGKRPIPLIGALMKKKIESSMQTLVGVVTPYAWYESDRVSEVSLSATDD